MIQKEGRSLVHFVKWFSELSNKDVAVAGGKGASLAEMYNNKFPIPPGFMITAQSYTYFLEHSGLMPKIKEILEHMDVEDTKKLTQASKDIRKIIDNAHMPKELEEAIVEAYDVLDVDSQHISKAKGGALDILRNSHEPPFVAVRSSATTEDLADASFAGQQDSFLNVKGKKQLIDKVKECMSSLFTARAIYYRQKKGFDHFKAQLSVVVQRMVNSDKSGVMFSKDPTSERNNIIIESVWGLGEGIVSGRIKPDHYEVSTDYDILVSNIYEKKVAIVRNSAGHDQIVKLNPEKANQQVLSTYEIKTLAQYGKKLEKHYGKPQDIEFAIEGHDIFIVQSRPVTVFYEKRAASDLGGNVLLTGLGASPGVGSGPVKIIHDLEELDKVKQGDILVTEMTNPDMVVSMQRAAGIITDEGGVTSHAAIVSREMGIPAVVGTGDATKRLKDGEMVTVDGNNGRVIEGKGETKTVEINPVVPTKTKIKVLIDIPSFAERAAKTGVKAIGLVRLEGTIATSGKHPFYFVQNNNMPAYVEIIYQGIKQISEHFEDIWIRTSDLRSDEYLHIDGAPKHVEANPMLGDHGVRFSIKHKEIMRAEVEAVKRLASEYPHKKFGIMVPQVINLDEVQKTKQIAREVGVPENVIVGIMVETPAAVQVIEDICKDGISFISFGTNDLTQYTLAIDRNNPQVQDLYDEMNPAVLKSLAYVIQTCKRYNVMTSICGQAASKEPMVRFLLNEGIDSLSVNADAAQRISMLVADVERQREEHHQ